MTLVGAVNPDFGQVEVDPAVVNLTAFETFFEEKRPFFTEGSQVFLRFGRSGAIDYTTYFYPEPLLFYSRRIGRAPQGQATGAVRGHAGLDHDPGRGQARRPQPRLERRRARRAHRARVRADRRRGGPQRAGGRAAHELLRGPRAARPRLARGDRLPGDGHEPRPAHARPRGAAAGARLPGRRRRPRLPRRQARLGRLRRALGQHASPAAAPRCCACSAPRSATTSGPTRRTWRSTRRPRRSRAGAGGSVSTRTAATSPSTPPCGGSAPASSRTTSASRPRRTGAAPTRSCSSASSRPTRFTRSRKLAIAKWWTFNFGRESQGDGVQLAGERAAAQLLDARPDARQVVEHARRQAHARRADHDPARHPDARRRVHERRAAPLLGDRRLRGAGPRVRQHAAGRCSATLNFRPFTALTLQATPYWLRVEDGRAVPADGARSHGDRDLRQPLRLRRPRAARGRDSAAPQPRALAEAVAPALHAGARLGRRLPARSRSSRRRGPTTSRSTAGTSARSRATPSCPSTRSTRTRTARRAPFRLAVPDFNFKSLRVNAVLRYEFRPGSAAYLVWTERRQDGTNPGDPAFGRDLGDLFAAPADDVLMVKIAWWFGKWGRSTVGCSASPSVWCSGVSALARRSRTGGWWCGGRAGPRRRRAS